MMYISFGDRKKERWDGPRCPVCGALCGEVYVACLKGNVVGCDGCLYSENAALNEECLGVRDGHSRH